jgi:hypothetical protein
MNNAATHRGAQAMTSTGTTAPVENRQATALPSLTGKLNIVRTRIFTFSQPQLTHS